VHLTLTYISIAGTDEVGGDFIDIKPAPIGGTDEVSKDFMVGGQWACMLLLKVPEHVYDYFYCRSNCS
jgi:hypothetical protein